MTAFYGSTAVPERIFGEGGLLESFYETMKENAPGPWEVNEAMLALWNPEALSNEWIMPDNFHVKVKIMSQSTVTVTMFNGVHEVIKRVNAPVEKGRSLGANMTHSVDGMIVREMGRRCDYDATKITNLQTVIYYNRIETTPKEVLNGNDELVLTLWNNYQATGFLSARILEVLDETNLQYVDGNVILDLLSTLPVKPFKVISVHDCFRCLPNYGNDLRRQYNQIMSEIARSNMLSSLVSQIAGRPITVTKIDPSLHIDILEANYSLS